MNVISMPETRMFRKLRISSWRRGVSLGQSKTLLLAHYKEARVLEAKVLLKRSPGPRRFFWPHLTYESVGHSQREESTH
jgi:hypothetical protein